LVPDAVLTGVVPALEATGAMLVEEVQGACRPDSPVLRQRLDLVSSLRTDRIRFLLDLSLCMPALPRSYLDALARHGADTRFVHTLDEVWTHGDPAAVIRPAMLSAHSPALAALLVTALTRFGSTEVADWRWFLPHVASVHLKFWELDDTGGAVSGPIRDLRGALASIGYAGTYCSEWGGHEWMPAEVDPVPMTAGHRRIFDATAPSPH
jgi:hypothetical protein